MTMDLTALNDALETRDRAMLGRLESSDDKLDSILDEQADQRERLKQIELAHSRMGRDDGAETKSIGALVAKSSELEELRRKGRGTARIPLNVKSTILSSGGAVGMVVPDARLEPVGLPRRELRVRNLLTVGQTNSNSVRYVRQTSRSNSAATVSEGSAKPEQALTFETVSADVQVIAAWVPASKQILDDAGALQTVIDAELSFAVRYREEQQLLHGDGDGPNLYGLIPLATAFSAPFAAESAQMLDKLLQAKAQLETSEFQATGVVLNSTDWARLQALKNGQEDYLGGGPFSPNSPRVWGMDVVATNAMTVAKFLVGDFKRAGAIFDRQEVTVEISTEHADFFTRNLVAVRAEERLALAVTQPAALVYGDFELVT